MTKPKNSYWFRRGAIDPISLGVLGFLAVSFIIGSVAVVRNNFDARSKAVNPPRYSCNFSTGTCISDPNGTYRSISECSESCRQTGCTNTCRYGFVAGSCDCKVGGCDPNPCKANETCLPTINGPECRGAPWCNTNKCPGGCSAPSVDGGICQQYCKPECPNGCAEVSITGGTCRAYCNKTCSTGQVCEATTDGGVCTTIQTECTGVVMYRCDGQVSLYCANQYTQTPNQLDCTSQGKTCIATSERCVGKVPIQPGEQCYPTQGCTCNGAPINTGGRCPNPSPTPTPPVPPCDQTLCPDGCFSTDNNQDGKLDCKPFCDSSCRNECSALTSTGGICNPYCTQLKEGECDYGCTPSTTGGSCNTCPATCTNGCEEGSTRCKNPPIFSDQIPINEQDTTDDCFCVGRKGYIEVDQTELTYDGFCRTCRADENGTCTLENEQICSGSENLLLYSCNETCRNYFCSCSSNSNCRNTTAIINTTCNGEKSQCEKLVTQQECNLNTGCFYNGIGCYSKSRTQIESEYQQVLTQQDQLFACAASINAGILDDRCDPFENRLDFNDTLTWNCFQDLYLAGSIPNFRNTECQSILSSVIDPIFSSVVACRDIAEVYNCRNYPYCTLFENSCIPITQDTLINDNSCSCIINGVQVPVGSVYQAPYFCQSCVDHGSSCQLEWQCRTGNVATTETEDYEFSQLLQRFRQLEQEYNVSIGYNEIVVLNEITYETLQYSLNLMNEAGLLDIYTNRLQINLFLERPEYGLYGFTTGLDSVGAAVNIGVPNTYLRHRTGILPFITSALIHEVTHNHTFSEVPQSFCEGQPEQCTFLEAFLFAVVRDDPNLEILTGSTITNEEYFDNHGSVDTEIQANYTADYFESPESFFRDHPCTYAFLSDPEGPLDGLEVETVEGTYEIRRTTNSRHEEAVSRCQESQ